MRQPSDKLPGGVSDGPTAIATPEAEMRIETTRLEIATDEGVSIADLTGEVNAFIRSTGVRDGLCVMMVGRDEGFLSLAPELEDAFDDLMRLVREASDPGRVVTHAEVGHAADRADVDMSKPAPPGFLAESLSFSVRDGAPDLGNWESILFVDGGGPARRAIDVTVMGGAASA